MDKRAQINDIGQFVVFNPYTIPARKYELVEDEMGVIVRVVDNNDACEHEMVEVDWLHDKFEDGPGRFWHTKYLMRLYMEAEDYNERQS